MISNWCGRFRCRMAVSHQLSAIRGCALRGWRARDTWAGKNRRLAGAQREAALQAQELQSLRAENRRLETALHLAEQLPLKTRGVRVLQLQTTLNEHVMWIGGEGLSG